MQRFPVGSLFGGFSMFHKPAASRLDLVISNVDMWGWVKTYSYDMTLGINIPKSQRIDLGYHPGRLLTRGWVKRTYKVSKVRPRSYQLAWKNPMVTNPLRGI